MDMGFLKPLHDEELNSEGEVVIAGSNFDRCEILSRLEPDTYDLAFSEWLYDRQEQLLSKADEVLSLYDNRGRYEQLSTAFRQGNLVPFIGAGMSVASGYPSWTDFLYQCCEESGIEELTLTKLLNDGLYEEAAQLIKDEMSAPVFNELLDSTFSLDRKVQGAIHYLPLMFNKKHVITTNFDKLLECVYEEKSKPFKGGAVKSGRSLAEISGNLQQTPRVLIKIHGNCDQVAERVLLKDEYDQAYKNEGDVSRFFERTIFRDSLLFLGASLSVDRTIKKMESIVSELGHETLPRHYAFLELKDRDDRAARKRELAKANIFPIWYPEGEHDESIEALLYKLVRDKE